MKGFDWVFFKVIYIELCYVVYLLLKGGSYIVILWNSELLANIKNKD